jgi:uncharacterized integral membrane protein
VLSKSRIFKFLKRDCGTIPVAEITSGKIEFFFKHQRFLIATESSKYLLIFVLYVCVILLLLLLLLLTANRLDAQLEALPKRK